MRYDYKYRINNKDKGDLAMELKRINKCRTGCDEMYLGLWKGYAITAVD